jgi:hypothetical protein
MTHVTRTCVGALALAAALTGWTSASPAAAGNVEIVVDGAALQRYAHQGRWYVEAQKGREYAIRLRNPYPVRVGVALSVDGLNTIDARVTSARQARKWVLEPYETVTISGWQTSQLEARRFEFTTEERSYGQALDKTANLGVISAAFFRERHAAVATPPSRERKADPESARDAAAAAPAQAGSPSPAQERAERAASDRDEYAATGMGRPTGHAVTQVHIDLETSPSQSTEIRYEFRPQLVKLGILPAGVHNDPLSRRERARGFQGDFAPVLPMPR